MNPTLSIVIPAREEERSIEATIRQFEELRIPHEVIVCDAQSSDRTAEIARAAGAAVVVDSSGIRRAAQQRNTGASAARGTFLVFVDVTVRFPAINTFFERALRYFSDPRFAGVGGAQWIEPSVATWTDWIMLTITNWSLRYQNNVQHRGICSGKFQMVRRESFEQIGGYDITLVTGEDHDLFERLGKRGTVFLDKKLAYYYSGRREHAWGWLRLIRYWMRDKAAIAATGHSYTDDWAPISK